MTRSVTSATPAPHTDRSFINQMDTLIDIAAQQFSDHIIQLEDDPPLSEAPTSMDDDTLDMDDADDDITSVTVGSSSKRPSPGGDNKDISIDSSKPPRVSPRKKSPTEKQPAKRTRRRMSEQQLTALEAAFGQVS